MLSEIKLMNPTIARRMALTLAASVAITTGAVLGLSYLLHLSVVMSGNIAAKTRSQSEGSFELLNIAVRLQSSTQKMIQQSDPDAIEALMKENEAQVRRAQGKIDKIAQGNPGIAVAFQKLTQADAEVTDLILHAHNMESHQLMIEKANPAFEELLRAISQNQERLSQALDDEAERANSRTKRIQSAVYLAVAFTVLLMCVASVALLRSIMGSLSRLTRMIKDIAEGDGDVTKRLEIVGHDELSEVGRLFNLFMDKLQGLLRDVAGHARKLAAASEQLLEANQQITSNSGRTAAQASSATNVTHQVSHNLQSLSTGAGEMTSTIQSIAINANEAAKVAATAVNRAQETNSTVAKLGQSSAEIGVVIKVITGIAQQTNLLALNATIEAARAGEAGKGFAVVANEVKELAKQTAKATEDISRKITAIQGDAKGAVDAIGAITAVINQVNDISSSIAAAVEEQSATTNEMMRNANEAASGARDISENIGSVAQAADGTLKRAQDSEKAAQDLAGIAAQLRGLMAQFRIERRDSRLTISISVRIAATDAGGRAFEQEATTVNVSRHGSLLKGIQRKIARGSRISIMRPNRRENFVVVWTGEEGSAMAGQVGISAIDPRSQFWDDILKEETEPPHQPLPAPDLVPRAKAHSASM